MKNSSSKLAQAFYRSAQDHDAEVYLDSFGLPYFFHRTTFDADLVTHVPQVRTLGIKLLDGTDKRESKNMRHMELAVVSEIFRSLTNTASGHADALGKELFDPRQEKYRFYAEVQALAHKDKWDWRDVWRYLVVGKDDEIVLQIQRYPVTDAFAAGAKEEA